LYYAGLWFGPLLVSGVRFNARQPQYLAYVVFPLLISLALLGASPAQAHGDQLVRTQRGSHRREVPPDWPRWLATVVVSLGVAGFLVAQDVHTLGGDFSFATSLQNYYSNVRSDQSVWSSRSIALLPLQVPKIVASGWVEGWGQEENFLSVVDPAFHLEPGTGQFSVINQRGQVRAVAAKVTAVIRTGSLAAATTGTVVRQSNSPAVCSSLNSDQQFLRFAVPHQETSARLFVALSYAAVGTGTVQITTVSADGSYRENAWPATLPAGRHIAVYPLDGRSFDSVQFSPLAGDSSRVCVSGVAVVQPVRMSPDGGCSVVSLVGGTGPETTCERVVTSTAQLSTVIHPST
jgi:hypothetical protein